ncbi:hypothetical protein [Enterococcus hirae]|uniref:hypothetical protein n=1 Tax=Enterococcus hirae TaxID=1354 RepID=UPI000F6D8E5A|nr:hypothetical protein [Enterococcus hirae]VEE82121.1 Uncharacterised protein [Enterococcus hirae]
MKKLHQLISEKESELQNLEDSLGFGFPIVEQAKMTQISHLRLELEDLRQIEKSIQLNDNQQIVLEWLKNEFSENDLQYTLWSFTEDVYEKLEIGAGSLPYVEAWEKLKEKQKFEVLAAFAQWGLEQGENPNGIN